MKKDEKTWWLVYPELTRLKDLNIADKFLLSFIVYMSYQKKGCIFSNKYIAQKFLLSERQIQRMILKLRDNEYITASYSRAGIASTIRILHRTNKIPYVNIKKYEPVLIKMKAS